MELKLVRESDYVFLIFKKKSNALKFIKYQNCVCVYTHTHTHTHTQKSAFCMCLFMP